MNPLHDRLAELLADWRDDPVRFVEEAFTGDPRQPPPTLEEWQREALRAVATHDRVAIRSGHGVGKALAVGQTVFTPNGRRMIGQLKAGDYVAAPDGTFVRVFGVYPQGMRPLYRVSFNDGTSVLADEDHLWFTQDRREVEKRCAGSVRTTKDIARTLMSPKQRMILSRHAPKRWNHSLPPVAPMVLPEVVTTIDPYAAGRSLDPKDIVVFMGGSVRQRTACLRGMIDAAASATNIVHGATLQFGVGFSPVAAMAAYLCRSLGGWASIGAKGVLRMGRVPTADVLSPVVADARKVRVRETFITDVQFERQGEAVCIKVEHMDE